MSLEDIKKKITEKQGALYYLLNSVDLNKKRKGYKRQDWKHRADNPKNINKGVVMP